jgi:plasmid replication initiation protein
MLLRVEQREMERQHATSATIPAVSHPKDMGRDEMNFAEFPLGMLADRAPRGCKTLVFEQCIESRRRAQSGVRRLTVAATNEFGLPTAADDEVVLGLVQLTKAAGFSDRCVQFSRYELIRLLGWRDEGRSYRRLEESLNRWLGVALACSPESDPGSMRVEEPLEGARRTLDVTETKAT